MRLVKLLDTYIYVVFVMQYVHALSNILYTYCVCRIIRDANNKIQPNLRAW